MRRSLTALLLCSQFALTTVAQQPAPWPPPMPEAPVRRKTDAQKPTQPAQPKRDDDLDIVKITTNLVQVDAIVTDEKGKPVTDLRSNEVEILEDGKVRDISNLSYISLAPKKSESTSESKSADNAVAPPVPLKPEQTRRTMALVVDDLGLSFDSSTYVRRSLKKFVDEQMGPNDLVAIIRSGSGIGALQQFTNDKRQLYAAIERVKWNPNSRAITASFSPFGNGDRIPGPDARMKDSALVNFDQFREEIYTTGTLGALSYVIRGLRQLPGRKSVVLFSDGFQMLNTKNPFNSDSRILDALHRLTDLANRASVVIYTVHALGLQTLGINAADHIETNGGRELELLLRGRRNDFFDSQDGLEYLAARTGGLAFKNGNDLSDSVRRIVSDQEGYYLIGYRPDASTFAQSNGRIKFHDVSLKIKRPGKFKVRMRNGFYGVSNEQIATVAQTPQQQIVGALASPFGASGVQLRLTSLFVNDPKVGSAMRSFLHVNAGDIDFKVEPDGAHKAVVDLVAVTFGDNGQIVDQFSYQQILRIRKENFARVAKNGFTYNVTIPIKEPGAYQFRTALRDKSSGKVGSASQFIEVPDIKNNKLLVSGIVMKGMTVEDYLRAPGASADDEKADDIEGDTLPNSSSAVRQFRNGMALAYGFKIYNTQLDKLTAKPQLKVQVRVFRNGVVLFTGEETPYDASGQADLKRLTVNGGVQLGTNMSPGEYVLQVIVTDMVKEKPQVASQWLDFEIVK